MLLTPDILRKLGRSQLLAPRMVEGLPMTGLHRSRRSGAALEFDQYRLYAPGDDLRQLDWHLYARTDQLAVRMQTPDTPFRLGVILDASASMEYRGAGAPCSKYRFAAIAAASLGYIASRQGDELGLFCYQDGLSSNSGVRLSFEEFCRRVDGQSGGGQGVAAPALERCGDFLARRGMAVWISDFLSEPSQHAGYFRGLQAVGAGVLALQVLDPDELQFPFQDPRRFLDPEDSGHRPVDAFPERAREEYLQRFQEHQEKLYALCASLEVPLLTMATTDDLGLALSRWLA